MSSSPPARPRSLFVRTLARLWWLVDASRRLLLNLLFLLLIAAFAFAWLKRGPAPLQGKTALVLDLQGPVVEQRAGSVRSSALARARGDDVHSVRLRDVLAVLEAAAQDPNISSAVLVLDDLQSAGLPQLREIAAALQRFKAAGKPVVAWGSSYDQRQYFLAAQANETWLHPLGGVELQGYGGYRNYYRDALDKLGISVNLVRVGTYKSAGEPYIANAPSPAALEADGLLYGSLWATYTEGVERARKLAAGSVMRSINELPERLAAAGGSPAQMALDAKLVDGLKTRDELRSLMIERGAKDDQVKSFRQIGFEDYLARLQPKQTGDVVGVLVAEGEIVDGAAPPGQVGGRSTAALIRQAREDEHVKALVLRVNSPGGSVFGSELVRHELELTRAAGKPIVVSMGGVAASGGYWISLASDEVIADAATVTGSIGVFAMLPNASGALGKLGVHTGGVTTTWLGAAGDPRLPPDPRFIKTVQTSIDRIYLDFTSKVALARKSTPEKIDAVAQGRVWSGLQAKERGLVDRVGGLGDALQSAVQRAKLTAGSYRIEYLEPDGGRWAKLLDLLGADAQALAGRFDLRLVPAGLTPNVVRDVQHDLGWLGELADGHKRYGALAHCLCTPP